MKRILKGELSLEATVVSVWSVPSPQIMDGAFADPRKWADLLAQANPVRILLMRETVRGFDKKKGEYLLVDGSIVYL